MSDQPSRARDRGADVALRGWVVMRVAGIEIALHPSWLITFLLIGAAGATSLGPGLAPDAEIFGHWLIGAFVAVAFGACIVFHEMAHALIARLHGLEARRITLFLLGGVASIGPSPPSARAEFRIAVAGPLASILLAGILAAFAWAAAGTGDPVLPAEPDVAGVLALFALVNMILGVFNLVPGFPLDGGRILRSALWAATRNRARATRLAAAGGRLVGLGLMTGGAVILWTQEGGDRLPAIWWFVLGWFLFGAAGAASDAEGGRRTPPSQDGREAPEREAPDGRGPRPPGAA